MFLGHLGVAFAAKRATPSMSLGVAVAAATWIDLVWPLFVLAGVERVRIDPGNTTMTPLDFVYYPFTHSLLAVLIWSALAALVYASVARDRRGAVLVGALVASHWVLDFFTHRPDLPLWPGGPLAGLGLWNAPAATIALEGALFVGGVALYLGSTRPLDRVGRWALAALVAFLAAIDVVNLFGPPPPSEQAVAGAALSAWLFVPWAAWSDLHRAAAPTPPPVAGPA
jgi:hypothetical protein